MDKRHILFLVGLFGLAIQAGQLGAMDAHSGDSDSTVTDDDLAEQRQALPSQLPGRAAREEVEEVEEEEDIDVFYSREGQYLYLEGTDFGVRVLGHEFHVLKRSALGRAPVAVLELAPNRIFGRQVINCRSYDLDIVPGEKRYSRLRVYCDTFGDSLDVFIQAAPAARLEQKYFTQDADEDLETFCGKHEELAKTCAPWLVCFLKLIPTLMINEVNSFAQLKKKTCQGLNAWRTGKHKSVFAGLLGEYVVKGDLYHGIVTAEVWNEAETVRHMKMRLMDYRLVSKNDDEIGSLTLYQPALEDQSSKPLKLKLNRDDNAADKACLAGEAEEGQFTRRCRDEEIVYVCIETMYEHLMRAEPTQ